MFFTAIQPLNRSVQRTTKEHVLECKLLLYSAFSAISSYPRYLLHKLSWWWDSKAYQKGVCREALWSKYKCKVTEMHSSCTEKNGNKSEKIYERKDKYKVAWWQTIWIYMLTHSVWNIQITKYYGLVTRRNVNSFGSYKESCVGCIFSQTFSKWETLTRPFSKWWWQLV